MKTKQFQKGPLVCKMKTKKVFKLTKKLKK